VKTRYYGNIDPSNTILSYDVRRTLCVPHRNKYYSWRGCVWGGVFGIRSISEKVYGQLTRASKLRSWLTDAGVAHLANLLEWLRRPAPFNTKYTTSPWPWRTLAKNTVTIAYRRTPTNIYQRLRYMINKRVTMSYWVHGYRKTTAAVMRFWAALPLCPAPLKYDGGIRAMDRSVVDFYA